MFRTMIAAMAALALTTAAPATASEGDRFSEDFDPRVVYQIDIEDSKGRHSSIDRMLTFVGDAKGLVIKARRGIDRRYQARLDYSATPFFGQFSEHRYDKQDFSDEARVGEARAVGYDLVLLLDDGFASPIKSIAVMNKNFSFEARRAPKVDADEARADWQGRGRKVGDVYRYGDSLLVLVRPFVVTDSALW